MSNPIGAPGDGLSRRDFAKAAGTVGIAGAAGCASLSQQDDETPTQRSDGRLQSRQTDDLPTTSPPDVVNVDEQGNQVTIHSEPARHAAHPIETMGGPIELPRVWAFSADDGDPSVPGPIIRTTEGEDMEITLDNTNGKRPHTIHFHGVTKTWENDGVPTTTGITVQAGEKHTYQIPANVPGTHLYHCHYQTSRHMEMGMYGILRVDPKGYEPADKEYFMTLRDWDSRLSRRFAGEDVSYSPRDRRPDVFTVNGKVAPRTLHPEDGSPIVVQRGDTVRVHLVNAGYMSHPMHIHNHRFRVVEKDGTEVPNAMLHDRDVTNVAPGQRRTLEFDATVDPGVYLMHCHKVNHVMNGRSYPGGMLTGVVYESVMDTDIFANLMEYAGFEG
jgi:FtsP/CotA-like multicopper oxidase with cupredoxin domain